MQSNSSKKEYSDETRFDLDVSITAYSPESISVTEITSPREIDTFSAGTDNLWVNIEGLENTELIDACTSRFQLHELIKDDILQMSDHPMIEFYDDQLFVVMRMLSYDNGNDTFSSEYVSLVLGEKFLITFQEGLAGDVFGQIRSRLQKSKSKVRNSGVDFLCYLLLDTVVDHYITIIEKTGDKIEALEDDIIAAPAAGVLVTLHSLRNDLLSVKKSVIPLRDYLNRILVESSPVISHETMLYFRDLYNHITHAISTIEGYREITIGIQDLYHSTLSTKMNQVMKVLTIITTIFIPLSFIAGLYGMNFKNMPELEWHFGYYAVLGVMLVSTLGMAAMMKWKKWF